MTHFTATVPEICFGGSKVSFHIVWKDVTESLTAISSHCLAALPATDVFNSHMRLNAYYRTLIVVLLLLSNERQF